MEHIHAPHASDSRSLSSTGKVTVEAQGHLLKVIVQSRQDVPLSGGLRGSILKFTSRSRKRMLETLARLDESRMGFVCFVTLTYPPREIVPGFEQSTADRKAFFKRLQRRFPEASAIWRREWEERKSGEDAGTPYPHFHCLFFHLPFVHYIEVNRLWCEVIGASGYVRTEIRAVENWQHAFAYVAKYMAKAEREEDTDGEKVSGFEERESERALTADSPAGEAGAVGGEAAARSLVYRTYRAAEKEENAPDLPLTPKTGRHWGTFNRKKLPLAEPSSLCLSGGEWFNQAKGIAGEIFPPVLDNPYPGGFTLFTERADELKEIFTLLANGEGDE